MPVPRPTYRVLVKAVERLIEEELTHPFMAITKGLLSYRKTTDGKPITSRDVEEAWPALMKQFGLVDDGTGYDTWCLPGKGISLGKLMDLMTSTNVEDKRK